MTKINFRILTAIFIGVILITPYLSRAQSAALKSALNVVVQESALVETEDPEAKQTLILKVLNLSSLEATELRNNLKNLGELEETYAESRDQFLRELDSILDYCESFKDVLADDLNLEEVMAVGDAFKDWRETNYEGEIKKIVDFVLVFQQDKTLKIAENRLEKTSKDLAKNKTSRIKNEASRLLGQIKSSLEDARNFNETAKALFLPVEELDDSSATTTEEIISDEPQIEISAVSSTEPSFATSSDKILTKKPDAKELVENAMAKIKGAYLNFFQVNALIKKLR